MLGNLVSAGASLIGGLFGSSATKKANEQNAALARENMENQREFAQKGLTWKIDDAFNNAHRVHPIYSLGASTPSYTPVSANFAADTSLGSGIAGAGQDIGRAINATATKGQRIDAFTAASQKLALEKGGLENELLRTQLASQNARLRQNATPALPMPGDAYAIPGQGNSDLVKGQPLEVVHGKPGQPQSEPGPVTDVGHLRTSGGLYPAPSKDAKERIEDNWYHESMHFLRNNVLPTFAPVFNDAPGKAKPGHAWVFDPIYGYKQVRDTRLNKFLRYNWQR